MNDDSLQTWLAASLRRHNDEAERRDTDHAALAGIVEELITVLIGRGGLTEGHRKHFARAAEHARRSREPRVRLRVLVDKYTIPDAGIDCDALLPLCQARCCGFRFDLTSQDLDEGHIRWELERPYTIRHGPDGYCVHLDRARGGGCSAYEVRPATCRSFDCRSDRRVWLDFDKRIPAPMPDGVGPMQRPDG